MKRINILYTAILAVTLAGAGCKKEAFVEANLSPNTLYNVNPEDQFLAAASGCQDDFEYYYDVYRSLNLWMQYATNITGNSLNFTNPSANFNYRYAKIFYGRVGTYLSDALHIIDNMSAEEQAKRVYEKAIISIFKAYYAFYVSDINGSMPYTEAFQARYGGTFTPVYDRQQDLFNLLDEQIKSSVQQLETAQPVEQAALGSNDPFFGSAADQAKQWAKAGNALRLKIGMRLMKRDPTKLQSIATEVIGDAVQMSAVEDSWVLLTGPTYADGGGNFNPDNFAASKPVVDFMLAKADPRLRIFYRPNKDGVYLGSYPSPDVSRLPANLPLYSTPDTLSELQHRLFTPNFNEGNGTGDGVGFFPILTYAEYCFIRAELAARNIAGSDAAGWYTKGVTASIQFYNQRAKAAKVENYTEVAPAEIDAYLAAPGITFDASKAIDQIVCQAYLDFFRQPSEAWAWWKRTGYPNTTSVLPWATLTSNGVAMKLPRRASLVPLLTSDANYTNQKAAFDEMAQDPEFGSSPGDGFGRVWWDTQ